MAIPFDMRALLLVAATFVVAVPAQAQRVSMSDRVAALEQQANNPQPRLELLNRLDQLEGEVRELREQIEVLQNENEKLRQSGRSQYLDLDDRLKRLEEGAAPASEADAVAPSAGSAATTSEKAPAVHGDAGAVARTGDERAAYEVAFDALKTGRYADSARLFSSFLDLYPEGVYAPNAIYWLGESFYVTQNYQLAAEQFKALMQRYPTHDKASGALLKLGLSEFGLGNTDLAEQTLESVMVRYPGSDVARTADDRLRSIRLSRLR